MIYYKNVKEKYNGRKLLRWLHVKNNGSENFTFSSLFPIQVMLSSFLEIQRSTPLPRLGMREFHRAGVWQRPLVQEHLTLVSFILLQHWGQGVIRDDRKFSQLHSVAAINPTAQPQMDRVQSQKNTGN